MPLTRGRQVIARSTMGGWPLRLCVLLNIVIMLGYGLIDILIAGQILSAVNGGGLTVIVGVIVSAIISLVVVVFGIRLFHTYERYAFLSANTWWLMGNSSLPSFGNSFRGMSQLLR